MMRMGIIVLARLGSSRLPGKVLMDLAGKPVLQRVIERLRPVEADEILVATTRRDRDLPLVEFCEGLGVTCYRGSEDNVLERCIGAARENGYQAIVRLGADNPLLDSRVINQMLAVFREHEQMGRPLDYVSNSLERTFPLGLDADIMTVESLLAIEKALEGMSQEKRLSNQSNVVPYLHQNLHLFKTHGFKRESSRAAYRLTLDTPEDYELISRIYQALEPVKPGFHLEDILTLLEQNPEWAAINGSVIPQTGFWTKSEKDRFKSRYGAERD